MIVPHTFTMSIEVVEGCAYQHPYHLGTQERIARECVMRQFHDRKVSGLHTVTIALIYNCRIVDVYYGDKWHSQLHDADCFDFVSHNYGGL